MPKLTVKQAAAALGVSPKTIRRWACGPILRTGDGLFLALDLHPDTLYAAL